MKEYKMTYFDIDGGRAEPIRLAFHIGGITFEDERISFAEFREVREGYPFKAVPVLEIDGQPITQSNAQARYVGKLAGLYPDDNVQALYCDEVMDSVEDLSHAVGQTFGLEGDELKQARQELIEGRLTTYLQGLAGLLDRGGGEYFADGHLTVADLKVFVQTRALASGHLDHIPTDIVEEIAPALAQHGLRIADDPRVVAYYAR